MAKWMLAGALVIAAWTSAAAGGVAILGWQLTDNGDQDGFADTRETVTLTMTVENTSGLDLTGVVATLRTLATTRACLTAPQVILGSLAAGERRETTTGFVFVVPPGVQRTTVAQELAVHFAVDITSDQVTDLALHQTIGLDLDLDASGGATPTTFTEGFEFGFGSFVGRNLDDGRYDTNDCSPPNPADGYRCPYSINPNCLNDCSMGGSAAGATAFWWGIDAGRAYSGTKSLHMGNTAGTSTPMGVLEAVETTSPVHLGVGRVCATTRTTACVTAANCPIGEPCVDVMPFLSFKQQVSLMDSRSSNTPPGEAVDRAVVLAQLAASDGTPLGSWIKLNPSTNVYDAQGTDAFTNCMFDPLDDGSSEHDLYDPGYSLAGPSSTCFPEWTFAYQGDTSSPFSPANTGAADGPGLPGSLGVGTWVETRFSLSRFRGRSVRLRFLNSGLTVGQAGTWDAFFPPGPGDDGWWIDGVQVQDTLVTPSVVAVDTRANTGLPLSLPDGDGDGVYDACDNCTSLANAGQSDVDRDGFGDGCDVCPHDAGNDVDLDGLCAASDNCPDVANPGQADTDGDGVGDACDNCIHANPAQEPDEDGDGVACALDNCSTVGNPGQEDGDADGRGDACDVCPLDPQDDVDADTVCGDIDNCPTRVNPTQGPYVELAQDKNGFRILPDGDTVLLLDTFPEGAGLYRTHLSGGSPVLLTPPLIQDGRITEFLATPDGAVVVYRASAEVVERYELYAIPVAGGTPTKLSGPMVVGGNVVNFSITPDGARVVYEADQEVNGRQQVYSVPVGGGVPVRISDVVVSGGNAAGSVVTPDSSRVIYRADQQVNDEFELFSARVSGGGATRLTKPFPADGDVVSFAVTPDSTQVVYTGDQTVNNVFELWSVPVGGGTHTLLSGTALATQNLLITPDSSTVLYRGGGHLFAVPVTGGTASDLTPAAATVGSARLSPDGAFVVYRGIQGAGPNELYRVPTNGGAGIKLSAPLVAGGEVQLDYAIGGDGLRVVYRADQEVNDRFELWSVSAAGGPVVKLSVPNPQVSQITAFDDWRLSADGSRVVYHAWHSGRKEVFAVASGGGPSTRLSPGLDVSWPTTLDMTTSGATVLYPYSGNVHQADVDPDPDGDGVLSLCDNCDLVANTSQGDEDGDSWGSACDCDDTRSAVHPGASEINDGLDNGCDGEVDEISASLRFSDPGNDGAFSWAPQPGASSYDVARSDSPGFAGGCVLSATGTASWVDPANPSPGGGFFYLVRAGAPNVGSWGRPIACP